MATIKSYTDLEQSKKLADILPLESADMKYISFRHRDDTIEWIPQLGTPSKYDFPCWSLAALLGVLPNDENICINLSKGGCRISNLEHTNDWFVDYEDETDIWNNYATSANNPIDACYEMIIKLNELKML